MPVRGGSADKLGNRYESLWAVDQLLRVVDGQAAHLTPEPLNRDESHGVEFVVSIGDGTIEYWSVKRQTAKLSGWTLAALAAKDEQGQSILSHLLGHVECDSAHRAVFASTLGARDVEELRLYATEREMLDARLAQSEELKANFRTYVLPLFDGDMERARTFLLRMRTHATDHQQLRDRVNFAIRKLFYSASGTQLDVDAARGQLENLLVENMQRQITRRTILDKLARHSIRLREWSKENSVLGRVDAICNTFVTSVKSESIHGKILALEGCEKLLELGKGPVGKRMLVVSGAGGGKSSSLAEFAVERFQNSGIPVLALRFDQMPEGIVSTQELGQRLLLPDSPALTLAGIAEGAPCLLVVDQLDALSTISGRKADMWNVFEELEREVRQLPNMSFVVGCREFDLEHDYRIGKLKSEGQGFEVVKLGDLSIEQVDLSLRNAGTDPDRIPQTLKAILRVPLHLSLFLRLSPEVRAQVQNRDQLFDKFWCESERKVENRLGHRPRWAETIDQLANWLSANQELSAPKHVLDEFRQEAVAMASEHFFGFVEERYRFFHESLFDYAFARRFASRGGNLVDLLLSSEQHLFRRAQVRQVLTFLRTHDGRKYLQELEAVLAHPRVRFHIKRLIFQWLSALADPKDEEWEVLQRVCSPTAGLRDDFYNLAARQLAWFDLFDRTGILTAGLGSGNQAEEWKAIWPMGLPAIIEARPDRVAQLVRQYKRATESWSGYLRYIYRTGDAFKNESMFQLFLSHIDDGTLDNARPGFAVNDNWWSLLYGLAEKRPDLACEAIGHWFDRMVTKWRNKELGVNDSSEEKQEEWRRLKGAFDSSGQHWGVIPKASTAPLKYAKEMLPRIATLVEELAKEPSGRLKSDPLWCLRSFGESQFHVTDALFASLATCLELVAKESPTELDLLIQPFQGSDCDAIAFLMIRAWTAAPSIYADRLAAYLAADLRRLKVGYQTAGGGSFENYISVNGVRAASASCSPERLETLEEAILNLTDHWEARHQRLRGRRQLELFQVIDSSRLSERGRRKLEELQRKFPSARLEEPRPMQGGAVGSPIPEKAQELMSDDQWLRAMRKYSGVDFRWDRELSRSGGQGQLGISLMANAEKDPVRFAALTAKMSDELPASYFDAILHGISKSLGARKTSIPPKITVEQLTSLVLRVHALPGHPCGRALAWLFEKGADLNWPEEAIRVLVWHASNNPDPQEQAEDSTGNDIEVVLGIGKPVKPDPYSVGINSARGSAAEAVGHFLFQRPQLFERLQETVYAAATDPSAAVRSCAALALLAALNVAPGKAIAWFRESVATEPVLLGTPHVARFVHYAAYRDFDAIAPVIEKMLQSSSPEVVSSAAVEVCLLGLDLEKTVPWIEQVEGGSVTTRTAAAMVYATNVANPGVGSVCRNKLVRFFRDADEAVRIRAASAFQQINGLDTAAQAQLLGAFLDSEPAGLAFMPVIRSLASSPVQLPDLVCQLAQRCVQSNKKEAEDVSSEASAIGGELSKIVIRLYAHTKNSTIQSRCLDMIDEMERHNFAGLSAELQRVDR